MGYTLSIGNAVIKAIEGRLYVVVETYRHQVPHLVEMEADDSLRGPSYSAWNRFCRNGGLFEFFFQQDPAWMTPHNINHVSVIEASHVDAFDAALQTFRFFHPQAKPRFDATEDDSDLVRLIWLTYWSRWALENCEHPAFSWG